MNQGLLLLLVFNVGYLTSQSQSDQFSSEILEARKQGVYSNHADLYPANILTGRRLDYRDQFKQYFLGKYPSDGTLTFDGVLFEDVELQYDLYTQQIVVLLETENIERYITVTIDKVSSFSVYDHDFVHLPGDSVMAKGIYELAYAGVNSTVLIKRTNNRIKKISGNDLEIKFKPINKYYVKNEFGSFRITGKKQLIDAYQNSPRLISILKRNKTKFSKKKIEQDLVMAISHLETANIHTN